MKQRGKNPKYPDIIETWKRGEKIPEWLSDRAKVTFIDGSGNVTLEILETSEGGYEIKSSSGDKILILVKSRGDYVCFGGGQLFSLRPRQLEILYKKEEKR